MTGEVTITGATGMIGTELRNALSRKGIGYRALVRTAHRAEQVRDARAVVVGDVADPRAVAEACRGSAAVVHLARSSHQLADLCRFDYPAMHAVITAANENAAQLHLTSSQAVFGDAPVPAPVLDDSAAPAPSDAYGAMKAAWEGTARAECAVPPVVYRLPIVIPGRLRDGAAWLRDLLVTGCCRLDPGGPLVLRPRDGRFAHGGVSFVHVRDVADTITANLFRPEAGGTVAMLADPSYVTFRELAEQYAEVARHRGLAVRDDWSDPEDGAGNRGVMFRFDPSGAIQRLGFVSRGGRDRLLGQAVEWFREALDNGRLTG
jgi:nucleoside-diphosphate-sugar epimerase